ncbi:putative membrane protein (DUF2207) [Aequorivita sublithincola DSM 14238]|uniref:Putative membrane protein (DUF2207) n=1 Tax=Aequorivita sublithincola (strain DSM 14238 / LMG 21431 / ACAM 643 / 9-3) TaxID=746697 RepID=I3YX92_AEQSU|nr:DUF2207 domain-containing protein [Aequorivita sublithincola]AFL81610.1 putative membrane protein (DUF2207) [Aequorivita sublithincola DSM 14238]
MITKNIINYNHSLQFNKKLFLLLFGFLFFLEGFAQGFTVNNAQVDIYISKDGYFDVVEDYDLNFTEYKHGIYRNIQVNYDLLTDEGTQEKRRIKIRKVDVPDHKFESDPDFVQKLSDNLQIKIGDKDVTIIGPQHYQIKYRVYNAFLFEDSYIKFYWNIKPLDWYAVFQHINFSVHLPENVNTNLDDLFVYAGVAGDKTVSKDFDLTYDDGTFTAKSHDDFFSIPGQSVTVLINLPKNAVKEIKPLWPFWINYGWTLILGLMLLIFYWVWNKYGKDDRVVATTSYFPPSGMDPAMAGFLIDDSADTPDLISLIPYWGSRGILKMEQIPKANWFTKDDTRLTRLKPLPSNASEYEETIFNGLFGMDSSESEKSVLISSLKDTFYTKMSTAKLQLKEKAQIYYDAQANKIQTRTVIGVLIAGVLLFTIFLLTWGLWAAIAVVPVSIFLLIMTVYMVRKNSKGNEAFSDLKGFKNFIKIAEEGKLKMLLQDSPTYFETTMGYALAFGLFSQWSKKFEALNLQPPSWYTSSAGAFTMHNFTNSFSDSIASTQSTMVSSPSSSSSGGGSSGGGFGGGGGGSW